jgi:hypothetical protein
MQIAKKAGIRAATEICQAGRRENSRGGYEALSTPLSRVFAAEVEMLDGLRETPWDFRR